MNTPNEATRTAAPSLAVFLRQNMREYGILIALVVIMVFFQIITGGVLVLEARKKLRPGTAVVVGPSSLQYRSMSSASARRAASSAADGSEAEVPESVMVCSPARSRELNA